MNSEAAGNLRKGNAALALRTAGASYQDIADALGLVSEQSARTLMEKALAASVPPEDRVEQRQIAGLRLERMIRSLWAQAIDEGNKNQLGVVRQVADLVTRHSKLMGYEAPAEYIVHTPTVDELKGFVFRVLAKTTPNVEEADVIDGEIMELEDGLS